MEPSNIKQAALDVMKETYPESNDSGFKGAFVTGFEEGVAWLLNQLQTTNPTNNPIV